MKKVLSVIIAIVMIVSCMPMAFATECEHVFNEATMVRPNALKDGSYVCSACGENVVLKRADYTEFNEAYIFWYTVVDMNIYTADSDKMFPMEFGESVMDTFVEILNENSLDKDKMFKLHEGEQDIVDEMVLAFNELKGLFDEYIKEINFEIYYDGSKLAKNLFRYFDVTYCFNQDIGIEFGESLHKESRELLYNSEAAYRDMKSAVQKGEATPSQEEIEALATAYSQAYDKFTNCIIGTHNYSAMADNGDGTHRADCTFCMVGEMSEAHTFGEYISNNDATTEADGTKTAKCEHCTATDTVVDEGSKIVVDTPEDEPTECEHVIGSDLVRPTVLADGSYACTECGETVVLERADYTAFYEAITFYYALVDTNVYAAGTNGLFVGGIGEELLEEFTGVLNKYGIDRNDMFKLHSGEQHILDEMVSIYNVYKEGVDGLIADGTLEVYYDGTELAKILTRYVEVTLCFVGQGKDFGATLRDESAETLLSAEAAYRDMKSAVQKGEATPSQDEIEALATAYGQAYDKFTNCIAGIHNGSAVFDNGDGTHKTGCTFCVVGEVTEAHTFGEYISNNDATIEADGTKTAKCEYCTATDTVVDEGSKLVVDTPEDEPDDSPVDIPEDTTDDNDSDSAGNNFFTSFIVSIRAFFEKIANFFRNLFS